MEWALDILKLGLLLLAILAYVCLRVAWNWWAGKRLRELDAKWAKEEREEAKEGEESDRSSKVIRQRPRN